MIPTHEEYKQWLKGVMVKNKGEYDYESHAQLHAKLLFYKLTSGCSESFEDIARMSDEEFILWKLGQ